MTAIVVLASAVVPLLIVKGIVADRLFNKEIEQLGTRLLNTGNMLAADIGKNGYFDKQYDVAINAQIEQISYNYSGRIVIVASTYVVVKDTYIDQENKILISYEVNQAFHGIVTSNYDEEYGIIELTMPIYAADGNNIIGVLMFAVPDTPERDSLKYVNRVMNYAFDVVVIVMLLVAIAYAFGISRPLSKLAESIHGITSGYMDKRLDEKKGLG